MLFALEKAKFNGSLTNLVKREKRVTSLSCSVFQTDSSLCLVMEYQREDK
jgi:hypothetical protein